MLKRFYVVVLVNTEIALLVSSENLNFLWNYSGLLHDPTFGFPDEKNWPGDLCKKGGNHQSPIDIQTNYVIKDFGHAFIHADLQFKGYKSVLMSGVNNGYTIQFRTEGEEVIHPALSGGPLKHKYRLEQMHFHWPSEHAIDGVKFPMEIHFVHVRSDLTVPAALKKRDGLAIVSVMCNAVEELSEAQEDRVAPLMEYVAKLEKTGERFAGVVLDLNQLLTSKALYYAYTGSLTSPRCNEVVIWIILHEPLIISEEQYIQFRSVGFARNNSRSLQPIKHHLVFRPPPDTIWTMPDFVIFFREFFNSVGEFFSQTSGYTADMVKGKPRP